MNFLTLAAEYWTEAASGLIITALGLGYRHLSRRISEQDAIKNGIQALPDIRPYRIRGTG